jgi:hypothetical protein
MYTSSRIPRGGRGGGHPGRKRDGAERVCDQGDGRLRAQRPGPGEKEGATDYTTLCTVVYSCAL